MDNQPIEQESFGLGQLPSSATNKLLVSPSFTREDFEAALQKVFPQAQSLLGDQESLET